MIHKKILILSTAIIVVFSFIACTKNIREYRAGNETSDRSILVAMSGSDFKNAIADGLVARYASTANLKVIYMNSLRDVSTKDYDVIVIIDRALAWTAFNFAAKKFISNAEEKEKIILYLTVDDPKWKASISNVDGITSASKNEDPQRIINLLALEIDRRLEKKTREPGPRGSVPVNE